MGREENFSQFSFSGYATAVDVIDFNCTGAHFDIKYRNTPKSLTRPHYTGTYVQFISIIP